MPPTPARARLTTLAPPPLSPSSAHADGVRRCWGAEFATPLQSAYHDAVWGLAPPRGSGRLLFKQLVLQTFQSGLSWNTILQKSAGFEARFAQWDYAAVAQWGEADVAAALADPAIVRNGAKVRAAVTNAAAAAALDAAAPGGFEAFLWATCGALPPAERLLQHASRSGSYMRGTERTDFTTADGAHPTVGVMRVVRALKDAGFVFVGPATTLSFLQAAGFVNHHKPDCAAFAGAEAAFAAASGGASSGAGAGASGGRGTKRPRKRVALEAALVAKPAEEKPKRRRAGDA